MKKRPVLMDFLLLQDLHHQLTPSETSCCGHSSIGIEQLTFFIHGKIEFIVILTLQQFIVQARSPLLLRKAIMPSFSPKKLISITAMLSLTRETKH